MGTWRHVNVLASRASSAGAKAVTSLPPGGEVRQCYRAATGVVVLLLVTGATGSGLLSGEQIVLSPRARVRRFGDVFQTVHVLGQRSHLMTRFRDDTWKSAGRVGGTCEDCREG